MELLAVALASLLVGLSAILVTIAAAASARYRDGRLAAVGTAQALLGALGALALLHQLSPRYGAGLEVDDLPLAFAVGAVLLLYGAIIRRAPRSSPPTDHA